jgi:hypothetical protein
MQDKILNANVGDIIVVKDDEDHNFAIVKKKTKTGRYRIEEINKIIHRNHSQNQYSYAGQEGREFILHSYEVVTPQLTSDPPTSDDNTKITIRKPRGDTNKCYLIQGNGWHSRNGFGCFKPYDPDKLYHDHTDFGR